MVRDSLGDRLKDYEHQTRTRLPRRTYTLMRFDGKAFHTFTRGFARPFDDSLRRCMDAAALAVCKEAGGCKFGYLQSDEISIVMTDFDDLQTQAYFDGDVQKLCSILATTVANAFNEQFQKELYAKEMLLHRQTDGHPQGLVDIMHKVLNCPKAKFDARAWTVADPWEAFNTFKWRQDDATRNAIQMVAQSLYSHTELHGKNQSAMQEMIFQKGQNFNNFDVKWRRGSFVIKTEDAGWVIDENGPILNQDRPYFFNRVPLIPQPVFDAAAS